LQFVDKEDLLDSLTFSQESLNSGHRGLSLEVKRRLNHVLPMADFSGNKPSLSFRISERAIRALDTLIPKPINASFESKLCQKIEEYIGDFYDESNLRLKELTGISFGKI
jgi:hypothetical protein